MTYAIRIKSVSKYYGNNSQPTLKDINLSIAIGEKIGIVGENGAGKTTLLKLIAGNIAPSSGEIKIFGGLECLFDSSILLDPSQTPDEISHDFLFLKGIHKQDIRPIINDIQSFCDIGDRFYDPFYTLSLGMKARVQFAIKTSLQSEIVLVDEVLGAGDTTMALKSSKRIQKISESSTFVCVSHSLSHIRAFTNRCIWIKDNIIFLDGHTQDILEAYESYMNNKIENYLTSSKMSVQSNIKTSDSYSSRLEMQTNTNQILKAIAFNDNIKSDKKLESEYHPELLTYELSKAFIHDIHKSYEILTVSYYHRDKPHRISFSPVNIAAKLDGFVLGDGKWLLAICYQLKPQTIKYHFYDINVDPTNNSDPPLLVLNATTFLNKTQKITPYLSTRC